MKWSLFDSHLYLQSLPLQEDLIIVESSTIHEGAVRFWCLMVTCLWLINAVWKQVSR